jgi:hypothetical protein
MTPEPKGGSSEQADIPLAQRLMDNPILLLVLGLVVMFVFYTGWGMYEILSLKTAPLP